MLEIETPVKTAIVNAYCDKCGGEMVRADNMTLCTFPPQYKYKCTDCDHVETSFNIYPATKVYDV